MPSFQWEGTTSQGEYKMGIIEAPNEKEVENRLEKLNITPARIKKKAMELHLDIPFLSKVKSKSVVVWTRQLATMIDAGLPLMQCLEILAQQEPDRKFQKIIEDLKTSVESGNTFADSLKKHPKVFDNLFVNLVAAGEMGGILDTILNRLADHIEKAEKLQAKVKSAMRYPLIVLVIALAIAAGMLIKVVPTFASMFKSMGKDKLPGLTQTMMDLSDNFISYFPIFLGIVAVIIISFITFYRTERGKWIVDKILLKTPVFGLLIVKTSVAKFTRTLGTLVSSGVPILDSLEIVAKTVGNAVVEESIMYTREKISEGKSIAAPLMERDIFPKMVVQMISVGEATGAMDIMLSKIADFYDDEVDEQVDAVTALIEPMIMILVGGLVGVILIAMYLPIFTMAEGIKS